MTQTMQPRLWDKIKTEYYLKIAISDAKDNLSLLHSVLDNLITLSEILSRLNYVLQRKSMERNIYREYKGEAK